MTGQQMDEFRARADFTADEGIVINTRATTNTLPYRLAPADAFKIPKGGTWTLVVTWREDDETVELSSGCSASFTVRSAPGETAFIDLTEAAGITLGDSTQNIIITMSSTETDALSFVRGWAQLSITEADGKVTRLIEGFCDLVGQI